MNRVSSLLGMPDSRERPDASPASSARLVSDFEPGGRSAHRSGARAGSTRTRFQRRVSVLAHLCRSPRLSRHVSRVSSQISLSV